MQIIDMTCKGCGGTMDFVESKDVIYDFNPTSKTFIFFVEDTPHDIKCPYCGRENFIWKAGEKSLAAIKLSVAGNGNTTIAIGGNFEGTITVKN